MHFNMLEEDGMLGTRAIDTPVDLKIRLMFMTREVIILSRELWRLVSSFTMNSTSEFLKFPYHDHSWNSSMPKQCPKERSPIF